MLYHTNNNNLSETKTFMKRCIEEGDFCDVTISVKDGVRKCNSFIFLLAGSFWTDLLKSLEGNSVSCIILPDIDARSFDTMMKLLLDGFVTIQNKEKESMKQDIRTFFPNTPTKSIFDVKDSPLVCKFCLKRFSRKEAKIQHEETHRSKKRYACSICSKKFHTLEAKNSHEKGHQLTNFHYVCPSCGKCYKNHQDLMKHCRSKNHDYPEEEIYPKNKIITKAATERCDICNRWVKRLEHHKKTHHTDQGRKFECEICKFETDRKDTLATHQLLKHKMTNHKFSKLDETFKDGKPHYQCFECNQVFDKFSDIENHILLRSCEEFKCRICEKVFKQKKNLNQHVKNIHENIGKFECKKCGIIYAQKSSLGKHIKKNKKCQ